MSKELQSQESELVQTPEDKKDWETNEALRDAISKLDTAVINLPDEKRMEYTSKIQSLTEEAKKEKKREGLLLEE